MPKVSVGRAELDTRPHILYRFYDRTGVLLYIGITVDFAVRMATHAKEKDWWPRVDRSATRVEYYDSRRAALDAERDAIKAEKPLENDQHNEWVSVENLNKEVTDPDNPHSARDFVEAILDGAAEDELELAIRVHVALDGQGVSDMAVENNAAFSIALAAGNAREQLIDNLSDLRDALTFAADNRWQSFIPALSARWREINPHIEPTIHDGDQIFMLALTAAKFADYLDALPNKEGDGWRDCAASIRKHRSQAEMDIKAAELVHRYKTDGYVAPGLCAGPHQSGARCPRTDLTIIAFEVCPICTEGANCSGHDLWCAKHDSMARNGSLSMLDDNPLARFPIRTAPRDQRAAA